MVHRLTLAYHGADYAGWQRQPNAMTVQEKVEGAISDLFGQPLRIFGASRTDSGVHAQGQSAHLYLPKRFPLKGLVHGTNHRLPKDIRVLAAYRMPDGFHARKNTVGKEYSYRLLQGRVISPLIAPFSMQIGPTLDVVAIRRAMTYLPGRHDFTAFALQGGSHQQPYRRIFAATLEEHGQEIKLRFWGDGFLRGMIRGLVGTLVQIGIHQRSIENMQWLLSGQPRATAGPTAKAQGLCLEKVFYDRTWQPLDTYCP